MTRALIQALIQALIHALIHATSQESEFGEASSKAQDHIRGCEAAILRAC